MKRIILTILTLCLCFSAVYADEQGDEYYDDYEYKQNAAGDQFVKMHIGANFPLNFGDTLYPGLEAGLGYYRFVNDWCAVGGEFAGTTNISIGEKILVTVPILFGVALQPSVGKFEFPFYMNLGMGLQTWQNQTYFPSLVAKASAGVFYRAFESWSFGLSTTLYWMPEWNSDPSKNYDGLFLTAELSARYHF